MKNYLPFITIILLIQTAFCDSIKLPENNFRQGWYKSDFLLTFYENDLYGHIDGGAELFLEFGFDSLLVQDYTNGEASLSLEVYCMKSPEAALGIYLMKCGQEIPSRDIEARNSTNKYQSLAVKNSLYIQLNNFKGNTKAESIMPVLLNNLLSKIPVSGSLKIFSILPDKDKIPGSEKIIRGQYTLQSIYTFGDGDILQLEGKTFGVVASYKSEDNGQYTLIIIPYPDENKAKNIFNNLIKNLDPYLKIIDKNDNRLIFQDYQKKYGKVRLTNKTISIIIHLDVKPSM